MDNKETQKPISPPTNQQFPLQAPETVSGQPSNQQTAASNNQVGQQPINKPPKWRNFLINIGSIPVVGIVLFLLSMLTLAGKSGSEFGALLLFATLLPAMGVIALVNLICLPIYMAKYKVRGKELVLSIISLLSSIIIALFGAYAAYQMFVLFPNNVGERSAQLEDKVRQDAEHFANMGREITKEDAVTLLKSCQLKGLYYTDQKSKYGGAWGELSTTGVVLTEVDGKPRRISIADRLIPELVPIAREAQKTCGGPQFWHDGNYE